VFQRTVVRHVKFWIGYTHTNSVSNICLYVKNYKHDGGMKH
jgi:hypothetical protein